MAIDFNILSPSVVTGIVSRIFTPGNVLQRFFGFEMGGRNCFQVEGRSHSWDLFDNVRTPSKMRAPGTGPGTRAANPVGRVQVTVPRSYEKIGDISYEKLNNIRTLGQNAGSRDKMGYTYLEKQLGFVKHTHDNFRELLTYSMLRGELQIKFSGDDWIPVFSGGHVTVDYQIPAGNKTKLDMLGAGDILATSWDNAAAPIPTDLDQINAAFIQLTGAPLGFVITDSTVWRYVLDNTAVKAQAGSVNTAFVDFTETEDVNADGIKTGLRRGRIKAYPWLEWIIWDGTIEIDGTETKMYDGTKASFGIAPQQSFCQMAEGSELVKESPWAPPVERFGSHFWLREWDEAARVEIHGLTNAVPEWRIPKGLAFGLVKY